MSIKVLIVDDSNFMRKALTRMIESEPGFTVADQVSNGSDALKVIPKLQPHVVLLDVEMEGMDGLMTLKKIMDTHPTPVIMFSAYTKKGADITLKCLQEGAVDFLEKPSGSISMDLNAVREALISRIRVAIRVKPHRKITKLVVPSTGIKNLTLPDISNSILAIGSSTGGVQALHNVIPLLPKDLPIPIVIVQHMPPMFTKTFAESLDADSAVTVKEGADGDVLKPGVVYIAPGGLHMTVAKDRSNNVVLRTSKEPSDELLRPCVDILFNSVANIYGKNTLAVILTGMGDDGTKGLRTLKEKNIISIAQDENTCVVYGMPKLAVDNGLIDVILPINRIADQIMAIINKSNAGI
ncbi:MAG: chemotaxis response regulator protein-glutamate methylesterase [Deltaproteobacteria bacterium]|nr:chemotaxis response regulator protein-glutamate methylesterase [Deltaproteobacteria bacterium]